MTDERTLQLRGNDWPAPPDASHNENKRILEIVKVIARRTAEQDYKGQLERLRAIRQIENKTHEQFNFGRLTRRHLCTL